MALPHEINNPLTTLYGYLHLFARKPRRESLAGMRDGAGPDPQHNGKTREGITGGEEISYVGDVAMIDLENI